MNLLPPRGVIEDASFDRSKALLLKKLRCQQSILDDLMPSIDYVLTWNPDCYPRVHGSEIHWFYTRAGVLPSLSIWYKADARSVTLVYIEEYQNGQDDESED